MNLFLHSKVPVRNQSQLSSSLGSQGASDRVGHDFEGIAEWHPAVAGAEVRVHTSCQISWRGIR